MEVNDKFNLWQCTWSNESYYYHWRIQNFSARKKYREVSDLHILFEHVFKKIFKKFFLLIACYQKMFENYKRNSLSKYLTELWLTCIWRRYTLPDFADGSYTFNRIHFKNDVKSMLLFLKKLLMAF